MNLTLPSLPACLTILAATPASAQVYADFETRNGQVDFGRFTVLLDHFFSPYTAANFVRLAEGTAPWLDPDDEGRLKTEPFYDGLTFHSATPSLEIASGSPSGDGRDGPGWTFRDDFRSTPTQFSVYMENDGPNTNGSRFFISLTGSPHPSLRSGHFTRLGEVLTGTNPPGGNGRGTVLNISNAPAGFITIKSVKIRYLGDAGAGFRLAMNDPQHPVHSLRPSSRAASFTFRRRAGKIFLDWDDTAGSIAQLWGSTDLKTWLGPLSGINVPGSPEFGLDLTPSIQFSPTGFFRGGVTDYPEWPSLERPLAGSIVQTNFFDPAIGNHTSAYSFDSTGERGTYASGLGSGAFIVTKSEVLGPWSTSLELTPTSGPQPTYRLILHSDLTWSNSNPLFALPRTANPSRLDGANLADPGTPLVGGQWTYNGPR